MNSQIQNKELTTKSDTESKSHQAYAQELSRIRQPYASCIKLRDDNQGVTSECESIINRYHEIEPLVRKERQINHKEKEDRMNAGENNQFQKAKNGTEVAKPMVTKSADHSGPSVTNKIMSNDQALTSKKKDILTNKEALSEEISSIRYLIEYMNNNNNKQII